MILELNNVVFEGSAPAGVSLMAHSGQMTCLQGGGASRCLLVMLGLAPVSRGFVSIDAEPLLPETASELRALMAYAPSQLATVGQICPYEPPTVQDVFSLKANRQLPISNGIFTEEVRRAGGAELVAVAGLLNRPVLLCDNPPAAAVDYLSAQAAKGRVVIVASDATSYSEKASVVYNI